MRNRKIFLVGIKGVAMTALAVYLKEKGYAVEGSDVSEIFHTDRILNERKITVHQGFDPEVIDKSISMVISTGAHQGSSNPQMKKARDLGIKSYMHGKFLGKILSEKEGISVAGCHGKTTVSAMIAGLLTSLGADPSYTVGTASITSLGAGGHFGRGKYFVSEADEYATDPVIDRTPRFLWQKPKYIVLTNIDYDHPDVYPDIEHTKKAFLEFIQNLKEDGMIFLNLDDRNTSDIAEKIKGKIISYGFSGRNSLVISHFHSGFENNFFHLKYEGMDLGEFMIKVPGRHNAINSAAAMLAVNSLGYSWDLLREKIKLFAGTKRRFEKIFDNGDIMLFDDYAHHPSEIRATLEAAKNWYSDRKIISIFQPHTFSRTRDLFEGFSKAFTSADKVIVTDIYPSAREKPDPTINSKMLVSGMNGIRKNACYAENQDNLLDLLEKNLSPDKTVIITMGAGDVYLCHDKIIRLAEGRLPK